MVTLVVATTADPASVGPASAFLAMPGWNPGPSVAAGMESFENGAVRLLKHQRSIVEEDYLDRHRRARRRGHFPQPPHRRLQSPRPHRPPHRYQKIFPPPRLCS
ncbi:hypothetical protein GW17_00010067 [Ensete ventricosum]|nr:hypothetical protein GW17_00010067 [Ensete ventricosum]RZR98855.1 hypothetical protein BHM03_00028301 [Ensete ventricosum]